jgi:hypothetical protein
MLTGVRGSGAHPKAGKTFPFVNAATLSVMKLHSTSARSASSDFLRSLAVRSVACFLATNGSHLLSPSCNFLRAKVTTID